MPNGPLNTHGTHSSPYSVSPQVQHIERATTLRGVGQDKGTPSCAHTGTTQPAPRKKVMRARETNSNPARSQKLLLQNSCANHAKIMLLLL